MAHKRARDEDVIVLSDGDDVVVLAGSPRAAAPAPAHWSCPACTLRQARAALSCSACGHAAPHATAAALAAAAASPPASAAAAAAAASAALPPPQPPLGALDFAPESLARLQGVAALLGAALAAPQGQARGVQVRLLASALCGGAVDFFSQADVGAGWACGWRCQQMVLSQLLAAPRLRGALLDGSGRAPSIACLQGALERAWARGFDEQGRAQLGGRVRGTTKLIGAGEAAALLRSLGVPAQWYSFHSFDDPNLEALLVGGGGGGGAAALARVRAARRTAEAVRARQDPAQPLLRSALGLPPPAAEPPAWHSCRAHDFDACAACYSAGSGSSGSGGGGGGASGGASGGGGQALRCQGGCALAPVAGGGDWQLQRTCNLCGGGEQGGRRAARRPPPPDTPQERQYLHARHSALLRWIGAHWGGPLAGRGGGGGGGGAGGGAGAGGVGAGGAGAGGAQPPFCCYLQHDGHSRVLLGYELTEGSGGGLAGASGAGAVAGALAAAPHLPRPSEHLALYILDPGVPQGELERGLRSGGHGWAPLVKRGLHTLRKAHYEVVWVPRAEEWGRYASVLTPSAAHCAPTRFFE